MNNKGFGLTEMILFIVASLVILVICVIALHENFGNVDTIYYDEETPQFIRNNKDNDTEVKLEIEEKEEEEENVTGKDKKYKELEDKMVSTSKVYITENYTGQTDRIIIKLSKLVEKEYMNELTDPSDSKIICTGYVIYDGADNYMPYLKCQDNYETTNYNNEFE